MKNKYILVLIVGALLFPTVTHASWWNPFSWFKKTAVPTVVQEQVIVPPVIAPVPLKEEVMKSSSNLNKETIKKPVIKPVTVPVQTVTSVPVVVTPPVVVAPTPVIQLSISNVSVDETYNSVEIRWDTSMKTESKFVLNGKEYLSQGGIGDDHFVEIRELKSDTKYNGYISVEGTPFFIHPFSVCNHTKHSLVQQTSVVPY